MRKRGRNDEQEREVKSRRRKGEEQKDERKKGRQREKN